MTKFRVVVIIPAKNEEKFLSLSTASIIINILRANLHDKVKVIIVDDGSTDNTYQIAKSFEREYTFIKVVRNPYKNIYDSSLGLTRAIRIGLNFAEKKLQWKWNLFMQLDADTVLETNYLTKILGVMNNLSNKKIGIIGGISVNERTSRIHIRNTGWLVKRDVWESCNRYTLLPSPDTMLQLCALKEGWKIATVKTAKMYLLRKTKHSPMKIGFTDGLTLVPLFHVILRSIRVLLENKNLEDLIGYLASFVQGVTYSIDEKKDLSLERRKLVTLRYKELISKIIK